MIKQELYKIFANKSAMIFIMAVLVLNVIQLVYLDNKANLWTADAYNEVWENIRECSGSEDVDSTEIKNRIDELVSAKTAEWNAKSAEEQYVARRMSEGIYTELQLLDRVQKEVNSAVGYNEYLVSVDEAAERYEMLSIFAEPDAYAYREILKMKELYGEMREKELMPAPSAGVRMASHSDITDILALVLLLYLTVTVWLKEREQNMLLLIRTAKNGRIKLAVSKMTVLLILCLCIGSALYGANIIISGIMYDLGELSRPLATVYEYKATLWEITVGEFIVFNLFFKVLSYIFIMLLLSVICLCVKSSVAAFSGIIMVSGIGCLMYYKIPALSTWTAFKYLNPFGILKTESFFEGYKGINFFDYPLDYRFCVIVLFVIGYIVFSIITIRFFTDYIIKGKRRVYGLFKRLTDFVVNLRRCVEKHTSLMLHELHRILICQGAFVVSAIALVLLISDISGQKVRYTNEADYYEAQYLKQLEGSVTEKKTAFIDAEYERLKRATDDSEKEQKKAIQRIKSRLSYLMANEGACFIYDVPHNKLTAEFTDRDDYLWAVYVMILLVLCMPGFFAPDLQNGMHRIIEVTAKGRRKLKLLRYVFGSVLAVLFVIMVHLLRHVHIMHEYEVKPEVMTYPVNSLMHLESFGNGITVGGYYLLLYLLWIVSAILGAALIYRLSTWIKSPVYTILAGIVILIFPMLIALYSDGLVYASYPHSAFAGNLFLQNKNAAVVSVVAWGLFFVAERVVTMFVRARRSGK